CETAARIMSGSPGTGGSNPRKFSEKIALHNQKQAEETRAFEQLMTDLTVSRVQFQKVQQLRLTQSRAQYYGSLPNVHQIGNAATEFQGGFPSGLVSARGTRHHGLVERVPRDRNRINSPHRRPEAHIESSPYGAVYLSPPLDNNWRREQQPWTEDKRPGLRLISQLNRTNSDSALHTSAMNPNPQDPFGMNQQMGRGPLQRNGETVNNKHNGRLFAPHQSVTLQEMKRVKLWEAKKVQSLASRPKSCEVPGINIFPSPEQNPGLSHYQGLLNTSGSLPDLTNLHFASPLSTPLDPEDNGGFSHLSGGSSTGNLPAAMMHLGIGQSQGAPATMTPLSLPLCSSLFISAEQQSSLTSVLLQSSLFFSLRIPPFPPTLLVQNENFLFRLAHVGLKVSSDSCWLSLSCVGSCFGYQQHAKGAAPTLSALPASPACSGPGPADFNASQQQFSNRQTKTHPYQVLHGDYSTSGVPLLMATRKRPCRPVSVFLLPLKKLPVIPRCLCPFPLWDAGAGLRQRAQTHRRAPCYKNIYSPTHVMNGMSLYYYAIVLLDQFALLENAMSSTAGGSFFDPSSAPLLYYSQAALSGGSLQDPMHMRSNMLYPNCSGGLPNIILTDDSNPNLSKDISSALSTVPECFDSEGCFPLEDELRIEPLSLDGLSMLSDPDMVLPDPSVEDSFRSDRL
uniref:CREB regulated transcription coactivator 3 n=1 Tax=Gasterosteus aculeatus TaxID=69293 RepID=G3PZJ7_GASAC